MNTNSQDTQSGVLIKKASGEEEHFSSDKLKQSLINAGANIDTVNAIVLNIQEWIYTGVSTKEIYKRAFSILRREKTSTSILYRLKQAILELGPTGYPFEILMGEIFKAQGYQTEVGVVVNGHCVTHEMDVIATKDATQQLVECKYHKDQGKHVSVQVPLYVRSRVDDIIRKRKDLHEYANYEFTGWVVTNTRFSSDSIAYGTCSGLKLLAWDYPNGNGLKQLIEKYKLFPITILSKLTIKEKQMLLEKGIITCPQLLENTTVLDSFGFGKRKLMSVLSELNDICA